MKSLLLIAAVVLVLLMLHVDPAAYPDEFGYRRLPTYVKGYDGCGKAGKGHRRKAYTSGFT